MKIKQEAFGLIDTFPEFCHGNMSWLDQSQIVDKNLRSL